MRRTEMSQPETTLRPGTLANNFKRNWHERAKLH